MKMRPLAFVSGVQDAERISLVEGLLSPEFQVAWADPEESAVNEWLFARARVCLDAPKGKVVLLAVREESGFNLVRKFDLEHQAVTYAKKHFLLPDERVEDAPPTVALRLVEKTPA